MHDPPQIVDEVVTGVGVQVFNLSHFIVFLAPDPAENLVAMDILDTIRHEEVLWVVLAVKWLILSGHIAYYV